MEKVNERHAAPFSFCGKVALAYEGLHLVIKLTGMGFVGRATPVLLTLINNAGGAMRRSVRSGCQAFVAMMQTTDPRDSDYLSPFGRVDRAGIRTVFSQGQMRPCSVVIVLVRREDAAQMALVEDDEVVETLAPDRPMTLST